MKKPFLFIVFVIFFVIALSYTFLQDLFAHNLTALDAAHWALLDRPFLENRPKSMQTSQTCPAHWLESFPAFAQGDVEARDQAYQQAAACDPVYVKFLHRMYPLDVEMAQMILQTQPGSAESWFWAGDLIPEKRIEYYQQGLVLAPHDGRRWIALGDMLNKEVPLEAIQAYLKGCYNGDPGYNGCGRAGSLAEQMGDYPSAIIYYRLSSYPQTRQRADRLESKLQLTPTP